MHKIRLSAGRGQAIRRLAGPKQASRFNLAAIAPTYCLKRMHLTRILLLCSLTW